MRSMPPASRAWNLAHRTGSTKRKASRGSARTCCRAFGARGMSAVADDTFELYDLEIVVERIDGTCTCRMRVGDRVFLKSGKLSLPDGSDFCLYAFQAAIPLLPAKQRPGARADW